MLINFAAITHPGRVRKNNEDAYLVSGLDGEEPLVNRLRTPGRLCEAGLLVAVADGMGGAAAGEIASREGLAAMAVNLFSRWGRFSRQDHAEPVLWRALDAAAHEASAAVLRYSDEERSARGMGTTMTAAVIWNGSVYLAQVGDSRAYLLRDMDLVQLTTDQTLVHEMVASGMLSPEQARTHPQRSMITQALGAPQPLKVALGKVPLRRGDRLLLCSDGLHGEVEQSRLQDVLTARFGPVKTLELLVEAALAAGGRDNITALMVTLDDPGLPLGGPGDRIRIFAPSPRDLEQEAPGLLARIGRRLVGQP